MAADTAARVPTGQRGETLLESLIAIAIISVIAVAAYSGLQTSIRSSVQHKESAVAETLLRSAAERLQDPGTAYIPRAGCEGADTYSGLPSRPGYGAIQVDVRFWQPPAGTEPEPWPVLFAASGSPQHCPVLDPGLQAIDLRLTTPSGLTERLEIVKRGN